MVNVLKKINVFGAFNILEIISLKPFGIAQPEHLKVHL